jgi:hypothetical protein
MNGHASGYFGMSFSCQCVQGRRQQKARLGSTGRAFHRERQTSGREALFQIDGFRLHRLADDARISSAAARR